MIKQLVPLNLLFISLTSFANTPVKVGVKAGVFDAVLGASLPVQLLLVVLLACSVVSWAIIYTKYKQFQEFKEANDRFSQFFWRSPDLESVHNRLSEFIQSNLSHLFNAGYVELQKIADSNLASQNGQNENLKLSGLDNLQRAIEKSIATEVRQAESRLNFLATTGSTAPFVGLLGTVVGIMSSFSNIAASGSASLAVVAPGIAEALFSTAVGLFAAIPAVVAYNFYVGEVRKIETELNNFAADFLNVAKRNFFGDK